MGEGNDQRQPFLSYLGMDVKKREQTQVSQVQQSGRDITLTMAPSKVADKKRLRQEKAAVIADADAGAGLRGKRACLAEKAAAPPPPLAAPVALPLVDPDVERHCSRLAAPLRLSKQFNDSDLTNLALNTLHARFLPYKEPAGRPAALFMRPEGSDRGSWLHIQPFDFIVLRSAQGEDLVVWVERLDPAGGRLYGLPGSTDAPTFTDTAGTVGDFSFAEQLVNCRFFLVGRNSMRPQPYSVSDYRLLGFAHPLINMFCYDVATHDLTDFPHLQLRPQPVRMLNVVEVCVGVGGLTSGLASASIPGVPTALVPCVGVDINLNALYACKANKPLENSTAYELYSKHAFKAHLEEYVAQYCSLESFTASVVELNEALDAGRPKPPGSPSHSACVRGHCGLLTGGLPCQGFSAANPRNAKGGFTDDRNTLFRWFFKLLDVLQPDYCLLEEVPELAVSGACAQICALFAARGYNCRVRFVQAGHYGVPQSRLRVIVLSARQGLSLPLPPTPTHNFTGNGQPLKCGSYRANLVTPKASDRDRLKPMLTVKDVIDEVLEANPHGLKANTTAAEVNGVSFHCAPPLGADDKRRVEWVEEGGNGRQVPDRFWPGNVRPKWAENKYGRLSMGGAFGTILATAPNPSTGRWLHPSEDRLVTVRECALAQGFPLHYQLPTVEKKSNGRELNTVNMEAMYRAVGNAVPPPLAPALGQCILNAECGLQPPRPQLRWN